MRATTMLAGCVLLLLSTSVSAADDEVEEIKGKVISVADGDTIRIKDANGDVHRIRFVMCDAPESDQPFGQEATEFTEDAVLGKDVTIRSYGTDDYGRVLGEVIQPDGKSLNLELIKAGLAWWFYHYNDDTEIAAHEAQAKADRKGMFAARNPIYPRNWRSGARVDNGGQAPQGSIFIMALMPNPAGADAGHETVTIANKSSSPKSLNGWSIADDDGGSHSLDGVTVPASGAVTVVLSDAVALNNSGDVVMLRSSGGTEMHRIDYKTAMSGRFVTP